MYKRQIQNSTDEVLECDNEMLMSVYELEREWKNTIVVEWGQRVNFPLIVYNVDDVLMLFLQGKRPLLVNSTLVLSQCLLISLICFVTVSYTHLDVYKRQH